MCVGESVTENRQEYKKELGKRLKKARIEAGMTQEQAWERLETDYGYKSKKQLISSYERGYRMPPVDVLASLSKIYKKEIDEIVYKNKPL